MKDRERPRSGRDDTMHRMRQLHRMQFSPAGAVGAHHYDTLSLINLGNNRLNRLAWSQDVRVPVSYSRITAMQPLPSTARDLTTRATEMHGASIQAAIHRFVIAEQVQSWKSFADRAKSRRLVSQQEPRQPAALPDEIVQRQTLVVAGSSRSMFDLLRRRQATLHADAPARSLGETESGRTDRLATCKRKTNMMKKKEMLEEKHKQRRATRYILPEGSALVASDQSALAARNSIVLTALQEEDEREREEVRRRLWKLIKIEGAVNEEMKVQAREALSSGDMEAALKIIAKAESQVERLEASRSASFTIARTLAVRSFASNSSLPAVVADSELEKDCTSLPRNPLRPSTARFFQDSEAKTTALHGRARPVTARACMHQNALRLQIPSRPALESVSPSRSVSPSIGEKNEPTTPDAGLADKAAHVIQNAAQHARFHDSDCNAVGPDGLDDAGAKSPDAIDKVSEYEEADEKKAKHKMRSEKHRKMANWLRLADADAGCDHKALFDRVDLDYRRLTELPEWFLAPELRVRVVSLRKNNIPSLPDSFCLQLQFLEECDLSHNMLSCLPQTFGGLGSLKKLFLNENRLQGLPFSLGSLTKLQVLNIEKNSITRIPCSLLTVGGTLRTLITRGNPPFSQPPQLLIDDESLLGIRDHLSAVFTAGKASREQVWKELDARGMPVSALLMAIAGEDVAHNWEQKKGGRPSDPTFSKEQLEEKIRWEFKLVRSRDSFKALWEFLDQDGTGLLSHRQFLYQMKRPMRRATVDFSAAINETVERQSGREAASSVSAPIGKLEIASIALGSPLPDAIGTYCTIRFGTQYARTNVAKQTSAATRWTFPGQSPSDKTRELATLEMSVESLQNMPKMQVNVFEDTTPQEQVHGLSGRTRSTEVNGIGEVEICAEKLVDIMSNGNVEAELLCDIFSVEMVDEGSDVRGKEYRRPLYGADGSPARLTIKLKPFMFALDGRADAETLEHSGQVRLGLDDWIKQATHRESKKNV